MDSAHRSLQGRVAAHISWANTADRTERTAPARSGLQKRFEREVIEQAIAAGEIEMGDTLPAKDLARRAESRRKAHFTRMALKSAQVRKARKTAK